MRTNLWGPKPKHSFAVTLLHGLSEVWAALKGMASGLLVVKRCKLYAHWTEIGCAFHPSLALGILFTIMTQAVKCLGQEYNVAIWLDRFISVIFVSPS